MATIPRLGFSSSPGTRRRPLSPGAPAMMDGWSFSTVTGPGIWAVLALLLVVPAGCSDPAGPDQEPVEADVWHPFGQGLSGSPSAFVEWHGGLVVGGEFITAGDQPARNIARWDGNVWHTLGTGLDRTVQALEVHQDDLIAVLVQDEDEEEERVFRWAGGEWHPMGFPHVHPPHLTLAVHDGVLYVLASDLYRWTGSGWASVPVEVDGEVYEAGRSMAVHGDHLFVATDPENVVTDPVQLARWDGQRWEWFESPEDLSFHLHADDRELFAWAAGGARHWTGSGWEGISSPGLDRGSTTVHQGALVTGMGLFWSNRFYLLRWHGSEWIEIPGEMGDQINAIGSYGSMLVAGGDFTTIDGVPFRGIAGIIPSWTDDQGGS